MTPYTGDEKVRPKCPLCRDAMTFMEENKGYHCIKCDAMGFTHCHRRGNTIVGGA